MKKHLGVIYALAAYALWGVFPLFWKQLEHIPSEQIIAHRMVWAGVILSGFLILTRQWAQLKQVFAMPQTMARLVGASFFITLNWGVFIWAVNNGYIIEVSLGYFINPLINVLFGAVFFKERFTLAQGIALLIAVFGVSILVVHNGGLPLVSLALALSFAVYGMLKKKVSLPATHGLNIELLIVIVPAILFLFYTQQQGQTPFLSNVHDSIYLILGGLLTIIPLLFFAAAAKRVSLATLGMTQYLGPSCHLLIAVLIYNEPFEAHTRYAFICIWLALLVYTLDNRLGFVGQRLKQKTNGRTSA